MLDHCWNNVVVSLSISISTSEEEEWIDRWSAKLNFLTQAVWRKWGTGFELFFIEQKCFLFEIKWMKCLTSSWRWEKNVEGNSSFFTIFCFCFCYCCSSCSCFCCSCFQQQFKNSEMNERWSCSFLWLE